MGNFFPGINVFKHTLKFKLEKTRDVFRDVLVIFSSTDQFPNFYTFSFASLQLDAVLPTADDLPASS